VLDAVVDEDEKNKRKLKASKIEDVCNSRSLNNELSQRNERVIHIVYKDNSNINNMNVNNVENGFSEMISAETINKNENESSQKLNSDNEEEVSSMFKKVEDCEASNDEQEKVMLEVCKKSAELYENVVIVSLITAN
jgi:hypothetical protein